MTEELISKIIDDAHHMKEQRDLYRKNLSSDLNKIDEENLNESMQNIISFMNKTDDELLFNAYQKNYELIDEEREHVYVYLGSFKKTNHILFPDFCLEHDSSEVDYSTYGELVGSPNIIMVSINEREEFEQNNDVIYLNDYDPYIKYYELRKKYLHEIINNKDYDINSFVNVNKNK